MPADEVRRADVYAYAADALHQAPSTIVLLMRERAVERAGEVARRFPDATVHVLLDRRKPLDEPDQPAPAANVVLHPYADGTERHAILRTLPRPQLLVDANRPRTAAKLGNLRQLHGYVAAGGVYAIDGIDRRPGDTSGQDATVSVRSRLTEIAERAGEAPRDRGATRWIDSVAQSLAELTLRDDVALLRMRTSHPYKLRDAEADALLGARYGEQSPLTVLAVRPAYTFTSRALIVDHGEHRVERRPVYHVPTLELRAYDHALAYPRQLLRYGDFWLPDTFRHHAHPKLNHRGLIRSGSDLAALRPQWTPTRPRRIDGTYYYLDTEFPGHFGHVTTEVLSRLWGWERARRDDPDLRPLLSLRPGQTEPPSWVGDLFAAYGIDPSTIVAQQADELLEVERLVAASPQFENPYYVDAAISETWRRIGAAFAATPPPVRAEKLFVSRGRKRRGCLQADEVEAFVRDRGFEVVRPERYSYGEQVALFAQARVIAGYVGSGMFTMMHAPQAKVVLISGDAYIAQNEALIGAVNGNELHYFWGTTHVVEPEPGHAKPAFGDSFSFDLRAHRRQLAKALR